MFGAYFPHVGDPEPEQLLPVVDVHVELVVDFDPHGHISEVEGFQQRLVIFVHFVADRPHHGVVVEFYDLLVMPVLFGVGVGLEHDEWLLVCLMQWMLIVRQLELRVVCAGLLLLVNGSGILDVVIVLADAECAGLTECEYLEHGHDLPVEIDTDVLVGL